jgi:integrase
MTTPTEEVGWDAKPKLTREANLSPDGKWRSFPKVPNLVQYVSTGTYFGRIKIEGKVFRESLGTTVFTNAKLQLGDFLKKKRKQAASPLLGTFGEARVAYETELAADHSLKEASKVYRLRCIKAMLKSWPELDSLTPKEITKTDCLTWAAKYAKYSPTVFNNTVGTLRLILERAGLGRDENPAFKIKRLGVKPKELHLPEPKQFEEILRLIETAGSRYSQHCADFARFLAFSGCRLNEARLVHWRDINFDKLEIRVHNSKSGKTTSKADFRFVPIIPPMLELLNRLKSQNPHEPTDRVCMVGECEKALTAACGVKNGERLKRIKRGKEISLGIGIERITHHDLRHLFATRCIEAGVDIPTVSRWLGHSDGGSLAMKTYGHLRNEHSQAMAQKVKF